MKEPMLSKREYFALHAPMCPEMYIEAKPEALAKILFIESKWRVAFADALLHALNDKPESGAEG